MSLEEYCERYLENRIIDLKRELTAEEVKIIEKLEVKIENSLYNGAEYEKLKTAIGVYFSKYDKDKELKYKKPLKYGVTKEEYDKIYNKFTEIDEKYENLLEVNIPKKSFEAIWLNEKQHIRDKLITFLEKKTLNDTQKYQLFELIMNIEDATPMQKERFILYYGLDKEKIHSASKLAKLQHCTQSNIRQAINKIKSKIIRLPDEKIDIIREVIEEK